jgi:hypothetical protein
VAVEPSQLEQRLLRRVMLVAQVAQDRLLQLLGHLLLMLAAVVVEELLLVVWVDQVVAEMEHQPMVYPAQQTQEAVVVAGLLVPTTAASAALA